MPITTPHGLPALAAAVALGMLTLAALPAHAAPVRGGPPATPPGPAAPTYCSAADPFTANAAGLSTADVRYRGADAADCFGVATGNDNAAQMNQRSLFGFDDWAMLTRFDDGGDGGGTTSHPFAVDDPAGTLLFSLVYLGLVDGLHGYALNASASPAALLPATMTLAAVIKQGNGWAAYLFAQAVVSADATGSVNVGSFLTAFGPGQNDFSHTSFYGRGYAACMPGACGTSTGGGGPSGGPSGGPGGGPGNGDGGGGGSQPPNAVPEPASAVLTASALLALLATRRRQRPA